jgi:curved DNA-binding protein CbpA
MPDYYADLGVDKSATEEEIKAAARDAARKHHPDVGDGDKEAFARSRRAYAVLRDSEARARHDRGETDSDIPPQTFEQEVGARMAMMFDQVFAQMSDPATFDLMKGMKQFVRDVDNQTLSQIKMVGKQIAKLKRVQRRLKFKGQNRTNFIWHQLAAALRGNQDSIKNLQAERKLIRAVGERLEDYEYEFEVPKPVPNPFEGEMERITRLMQNPFSKTFTI